MARWSWVPALETLTPSTAASSALSSPAWNLSAITSRSRGGRPASALRTAARSSARSAASSVARGGVDRLGDQGGDALAAAQLVERGVARDPEQPGARPALARVVGAGLAEGALERLGGDVLGGGAAVQQRDDVGVHVVARIAVERVEVEAGRPGGCRGFERGAHRAGHGGTTSRRDFRHNSFLPLPFFRYARSSRRMSRHRRSPSRRRRSRPRARRIGGQPVGDGQRLRHGQAPERGRHPRLDAGRPARGRPQDALPRAVPRRRPLALRDRRRLRLAHAQALGRARDRVGLELRVRAPGEADHLPRRRALPLGARRPHRGRRQGDHRAPATARRPAPTRRATPPPPARSPERTAAGRW